MICRGKVRRCFPWQCDHGLEIADAMKVEESCENCGGGISARALVGHIPKVGIVCGGSERSWAVVI